MNNFLSPENFQYLINFVFNDIKQKSNYDISNDKKYISILKKLIQTINSSHINKQVSTEYLNNLVIDKCIPFIIKKINSENTKNVNIQNVPKLQTPPRPQTTQNNEITDFSNLKLNNDVDIYQKSNVVDNVMGIATRDEEKVNYSSKFEQLQQERNYNSNSVPNDRPNFDENIEKDNSDLLSKMKALENDRNYNINQSSNQPSNQQNNQRSNQQNNQFSNQQNNQPSNQQTSDSVNNLNYENFSSQNVENDESFLNDLYSNQTNSSNLISENINNVSLNIQDTSNKLENYDSNINNLLENQNQESATKNKDSLMNTTYLNTKYNFERRKKKVVSIDISNDLPDMFNGDGNNKKVIDNLAGDYWSNFRVNFQEDLQLDKVTDIYLESIIINNPSQATNNSNLYLCIDISEFNIKTLSNNPFMFDKFIIPNENTSAPGTNKIMKYHLKSNYIATINPTTLSSLTFKLTNENNNTVYSNISTTEDSFINNTGGYDQGTNTPIKINEGDGSKFNVNDIVYDKNCKVIGIITSVDTATNPDTITFSAGTQIKLYNNQKIYLSNDKTAVIVNEPNGLEIGSTSIAVDGVNATTIFSTGDKLFKGSGELIGEITNCETNTITIDDGIQVFLENDIALYKNSPIAKVFASNSKLNRLIMEFVFISR